MLTIEHLTKVYANGLRANDDVTLRVGAGDVVALLGHNGAGKTTLINQAAGLVIPTSGSIRVAGCDPVADPARARRTVSLMPQAHAPLSGVTPRQAVEMLARIRGAPRKQACGEAARLISALDIEEWADTPGEKLSGGARRLTAFCMTAVHSGQVLMLDEPTNDVDPVRRRLLWTRIRAIADEGRAVLVVTHNIAEAETYADLVVLLNAGRVVAEGSPAQLRETHLTGLEDTYRLLVGAEGTGREGEGDRAALDH
ncbi:ABC transporter ATP-binding protein [Streptomyces sp. ADI93-02]|uniref:ABC transporter ATP-binding protein n=1 Tax=Streptomyces sp. ADI93-02 TaxID=1522757 RepID=UPI000F558C24|nr:ABC transporter ATP-binding protein [Streptomyces sp. ADI93-02]RPK40889.1 Daunorubicin/doxorubicin resistance ATP-binding protein DrrA [Streptomyces sp. ADI93-02]